MRTFLLFFILLLAFTPQCEATYFQKLSVDEGLSSRKTFSLAKDQKGYLWIATSTHIDRFNGETFISYELPQQKDMYESRPHAVICSSDGNIYASTHKHIYRFNRDKDLFERLDYVQFPVSMSIRRIAMDEHKNLWIATDKGLFRANEQEKTQLVYNSHDFKNLHIIKKKLYFSTQDGILTLSQDSKGQYTFKKILEGSKIDHMGIETLYYDYKTEYLWIGTFSDGLFVYNLNDERLVSETNNDIKQPIRKILSISNNRIWAGIDGRGILEYNRFTGELLKNYTHSSHINHLFSDNIYDICSTPSKIWICTYNAGLMVYNKNNIIEKIYSKGNNVHQSIIENHVNIIFEDSKNNLWFGTDKGISKLNTETHLWDYYYNDSKNKGSVVLSIMEDQEYNIWTGGFACNLVCYEKGENKKRKTHTEGDKQVFNYIYSIAEDQEKDGIWMGGTSRLLTYYDLKTKKYQQYPSYQTNKIVAYGKDSLILATNRGVTFFNKKTKTSSPLNLRNSDNDTNFHTYPISNGITISPTNADEIWITTEGDGAFIYNIKTNDITQIGVKQGLSSNIACGVLFDSQGRAWISTENGLNCYNPKNKHIYFFDQTDGLPTNAFNFLAYAKRKNGNHIWGTPEGAVEINPERFTEETLSPLNLHFENFSLFYNKVTSQTKNSPLASDIDDVKEKINLSHQQHSFTIDFINLDYSKNAIYTWKLDGIDQDWITPTSEHKATYNNLPPGKYTFWVRTFMASTPNDFMERSIQFVIHPPFWWTPLAKFFYFIIIGVFIYIFIKAYKNRLDATASDQKIRFFINTAHDIRTPLTLIKAPLSEIDASTLNEEEQNALQLAKNNTEKLLNMVTQLMDFQKLEREAMRLYVEETNLKLFFENCVTNFQPLAIQKNIDLSLDITKEEGKGWIDRKKLNIIVDNLISNAIKYTKPHGNVCIKVDCNDRYLTLKVIDDGIGISQAAQKKLFNRFYRADNAVNSSETGSGIGLLLTKKMVLLHKGKISLSSKEKMGTTFTVELPIYEKAYNSSEILVKEAFTHQESTDDEHINEGLSNIRLLLVEDNEELRSYLSHIMRKSYTVFVAANGQEGLEMVKKKNPDIVLSDVMMPVLSGLEMCKILKSNIETCHIPVILLTALSEREEVVKGLNAGADDYMTKPFDMFILESKIKNILKNKELFRKKYLDKSAFTETVSGMNELDKEFMAKVIEYIEEQMSNEDFNIEALATNMAMSRSSFFKKIKSLTGQNPQEFIRDLRMKKAASFLLEQKYTIGEIAYLVGFPNAKYFSTAFKKYYGTTPSQFAETDNQQKEKEE